MKALTIWQPWASLIAWGEKLYETRPFATQYRGPLAIHAGLDDSALDVVDANSFYRAAFKRHGDPVLTKLPFGKVICVVDLVRVELAEDINYDEGGITIYHGDCREILPMLGPADAVITDPPYGVTALKWDVRVEGWMGLLPSACCWCFGSMKYFLAERFDGWSYAQELVWEKHNGSNFHADRFRRVHELIVQFYRGDWAAIYKQPQFTPTAQRRTVRTRPRQAHFGKIDSTPYESEDGGPLIMRSVLFARSCHGYAEHPTQKPISVIAPLIEYSCSPGGVVLDPFMGSGSTLIAAKQAGRSAIGIELQEIYCEIAVKRLAQGVLAL